MGNSRNISRGSGFLPCLPSALGSRLQRGGAGAGWSCTGAGSNLAPSPTPALAAALCQDSHLQGHMVNEAGEQIQDKNKPDLAHRIILAWVGTGIRGWGQGRRQKQLAIVLPFTETSVTGFLVISCTGQCVGTQGAGSFLHTSSLESIHHNTGIHSPSAAGINDS